ncbi:MAG: DNA-directed RNA polymerase subunit L [Candidatus Micrarchaeota archaeon]|nr:DNA-directed RNA polymerase subunit L [Candidatus Micrarchaeota archaeon]
MDVNILVNDKKTVEFEMIGVDQTIPRLIVEKLNADSSVEFAAYKQEHPTVSNPTILVKTKKGDALDVVVKAIEELKDDLSSFRTKFKDAIK